MSTAPSIFSTPPAPGSTPGQLAPDGTVATTVIETVGVEVLDGVPRSPSNDSKAPANGNGLIPFASTLRRVG